MYDELIKQLRNRRMCIQGLGTLNDYPLLGEAADAIEELSKPRWIPVTERLPNNDDFVIVTVKDESGDSPYVYSDFGWYLDRAECWIVETEQRTDITHWMPLPKGPEEE